MATDTECLAVLLACISNMYTVSSTIIRTESKNNNVYIMRQPHMADPVENEKGLHNEVIGRGPLEPKDGVTLLKMVPVDDNSSIINKQQAPCLPTDGLPCGPGTRRRHYCSSGVCPIGPRFHCYVPCNHTVFFRPTKNDVAFYLYTNNQQRGVRYTTATWQRVPSAVLSGTVRFVVHGWEGSYRVDYAQHLVTQLLKNRDHPASAIFSVDWKKLGGSEIFFPSCHATEHVGRILANFIKLLEKKGASRRKMHLIGYSLGGKVVSAAGKKLQSPKVGRISGIDSPTGCLILSCGANLQSGDASFVDNLHNTFISGPTQQAHADFYPNGPHECLEEIIFHPVRTIRSVHKMHRLAVKYYIDSVNVCEFNARACRGWKYYPAHCKPITNRMGFYATMPPDKKREKYYLKLSKKRPYC